MEHIFLFEFVKRGANIILYGLGKVGRSYIEQIKETNWCNIVGVSDIKNYCGEYAYFKLEELKDLKNIDYIVIAIQAPVIATQVYNELVAQGICENKLLNVNRRYNNFPVSKEYGLQNEKIQIAVVEGGGFGDALFAMLLITKMYKLLKSKCDIIFYNKYEKYFSIYSNLIIAETLERYSDQLFEKFDLVIHMHNIPIVSYINHERVKRQSQDLYCYCEDNMRYFQNLFSNNTNNYRFTKYALLLGKNRIEQLDLHNLIGITRYDKLNIPIEREGLKCLHKYYLFRKKYITVNRDVGNGQSSHTKLWPTEYYQELLKYIKKKYKEYDLVLIGKVSDKKLVPYMDIDLTGKLSLLEVNVVLKYAFFHIGTEGGMVHLKHFLHGKSMVFFGPTDPDVFGYEENINIYSDKCKEHCEWLVDNWDKKCILNKGIPECLYAVKPAMAIKAFDNFVNQRKEYIFNAIALEEQLYLNLQHHIKYEIEKYNLPYGDNECDWAIEIDLGENDEEYYVLSEALRVISSEGKVIVNLRKQHIPEDIFRLLNIKFIGSNSDFSKIIVFKEENRV